jgi:ribonuclease D
MLLISKQNELNEIYQLIGSSKAISIDTEFVRRDTYFPILSLIQIKTDYHDLIIDALTGINLLPIKHILANSAILKIFHAPREDLFIFYHLFKELPQNIFDTQLAANLCQLGNFLSYSDLCYKICGTVIDKQYQKANWLQRPISSEMLNYAIKDVEYLQELYSTLMGILSEQNIYDNYQNQINLLLDYQNYTVNHTKILKRIQLPNYSKQFIARMEIFVAFREEWAIKLNIPRQHFITDEDLIKICQSFPTSSNAFNKLNLSSKHLTNPKYKNKIIDLILGYNEP